MHAAHRTSSFLLLLAALPLVAAALSGCGAHETPRFRVADAAVTERTSEGFVVTFLIDGVNPGDDALPLRQVSYTLSLDGKRVFDGVRSAEATLPRQGGQQFRLPVAVPRDLWPDELGEADYTLNARVTYLAPGALAEILFDSGFRRPKVSFRESGVLTAGAVSVE